MGSRARILGEGTGGMKTCSCGREFSAEEFAELPSIGSILVVEDLAECSCLYGKGPFATAADHLSDCEGLAHWISLHNCPSCHSTLAERI